VPADKGLCADNPPTSDLHYRLIHERELLPLNREGQIATKVVQSSGLGMHLGVKQGNLSPSASFGAIHSRISISKQILRVLNQAVSQGDTDASAGSDFSGSDREWKRDAFDDALRNRHRFAC
jgi:hypothetical protein